MLLALEPLTLHRAALVPQHLPNPALCFSQFTKQIRRTETVFMSSSPKNKMSIKCQPTDRFETTAVHYCGVREGLLMIIQCLSTRWYSTCGIWINKLEQSAGANGRGKSPAQHCFTFSFFFCFWSVLSSNSYLYSYYATLSIHNNILDFIKSQFGVGFTE